MRTLATQRVAVSRGAAALAALSLGLGGCNLDKVAVPDLSGPSTLGVSIILHIYPDVLLADAVSTAVVQAEVRGPDGAPLGGRTIFFAVTDERGNFVDLGTLQSTNGQFGLFPAPQATEVSASNGVATVVYRVPERISVTAIQPVFITARLVGDDATGQVYRSSQIELRPAEVRRFPETPGNPPPTCGIFIDPEVGPLPGGAYPVNTTIRFRSISSDASPGFIVQYFWDFGDGSQDDKPDAQHAWRTTGGFTVTHVVTDNNGAQSPCTRTITIAR